MKLEYINEFLTLGKVLNFSKAAEELYMSQSLLSRHISALEKELDIELFKRDTHSVELTKAGKTAMLSFAAIAEEQNHLIKEIEQIKAGFYGKLVIGVADLLLDDYFENRMSFFRKQHESIEVEIRSGHIEEVIRDFRKKETDIAFILSAAPVFPDAYYYPIGEIPVLCAVSEQNLLSGKDLISVQDLEGQSLVVPPAAEYTDFLNNLLSVHHITAGSLISTSNDYLLFPVVRREKALTLIPDPLKDYPHKDITVLPLDDPSIRFYTGAVFRKSADNPSVLLFLDSLIESEPD